MACIPILSASPSPTAPTAVFADHAAMSLTRRGHASAVIGVRDLPTTALLRADATDPAIAAVIRSVGRAEALILIAPVTRASTSGLLKGLVDLLPGLAGTPTLPVATGSFAAHARVLDHAVRPALAALGAHVLPTLFLSEHQAVLEPLHAALAAVAAAIPVRAA